MLTGLGPVLWFGLGFLGSGDPLWVYHETVGFAAVFGFTTGHGEVTHYLRWLAYIIGPAAFVALQLGYAARWRRWSLIHTFVPVQLVVLTVLYYIGPSTAGDWRYLAGIAPIIALIGAEGVEWLLQSPRATSPRVVLVGILLGAEVVGLGYLAAKGVAGQADTDYQARMLALASGVGFGMLALVGAISAAGRGLSGRVVQVALGASVLCSGLYCWIAVRPLALDASHIAVRQVYDWYRSGPYASRPALIGHNYFSYLMDEDPRSDERPRYSAAGLLAAAPGTIIIWDSHQSLFFGFVPLTFFEQPGFKELLHVTPSRVETNFDVPFEVRVFERVAP
jgi:hypothetical protein